MESSPRSRPERNSWNFSVTIETTIEKLIKPAAITKKVKIFPWTVSGDMSP